MTEKSSRYINVEDLMPQISLEQAAAFYGVSLPELRRIGQEVRSRCFLHCGKTEDTGDRALAIKADDPAKRWRCHQYGCGKGGNLVSLCDLMKPGTHCDGRPRGARFKAIAQDLQAMVSGVLCASDASGAGTADAAAPQSKDVKAEETARNVPLKDSDNERARKLVNLDEKFIVDVSAMNPPAATYFRSRPFLTPDVCRRWRMGYLPRDSGGDKSGGTMRGKVVYPILSSDGDVLTWFGREPDFERQHERWVQGGKKGREPEKFHFVKGFHRGLELFGQNRFMDESVRASVFELGLIVVEGPNDVIALESLSIPAVGLCSNTVTNEQVEKIAAMARAYAAGLVTLMLDGDEEGERGARQALSQLAPHCFVRMAWSREVEDGLLKDVQPESMSEAQWRKLWERWLPDVGCVPEWPVSGA